MLNKLILRLIQPAYAKALEDALFNQWHTVEEINKIQEQKFLKLISHCKGNVPYYSKILRDKTITSIKDLRIIPMLSKEIIKQHFQFIQTKNYPKSRLKNNSTSGSTGETTHFFSDNKTDVVRHACAHRGDSWTGWQFGEKSIILWGAERDIKKNIRSRLSNSCLLFNNLVLSSFYMTDQDMLGYVSLINNKKPTLIIGYPSSLELISSFIKSQNLEIHKPKGIITGGETLHSTQREIIGSVFKTKVLNRYGCREVGHIANECKEQNGLHISSDHVIVETVNENGLPCNPGELGEIVVTDLDNYVFPFIRYRIGDLGIISERTCSCGRPFQLLDSVEGRTFDMVVGSNGNRVLATFFTIFLKYSIAGIEKFQLIQDKIDEIKLYVVSDNRFNKEQEDKICEAFRLKLGQATSIQINRVVRIETTSEGKFRWIISKVSPFNQ